MPYGINCHDNFLGLVEQSFSPFHISISGSTLSKHSVSSKPSVPTSTSAHQEKTQNNMVESHSQSILNLFSTYESYP
ncbi:MAG: hypothetical protein PWQ63_614 [Methanolobus sp.]|jgi:hypothetical protein|nr:hypothetical protein [Methanolobus sp.]